MDTPGHGRPRVHLWLSPLLPCSQGDPLQAATEEGLPGPPLHGLSADPCERAQGSLLQEHVGEGGVTLSLNENFISKAI